MRPSTSPARASGGKIAEPAPHRRDGIHGDERLSARGASFAKRERRGGRQREEVLDATAHLLDEDLIALHLGDGVALEKEVHERALLVR